MIDERAKLKVTHPHLESHFLLCGYLLVKLVLPRPHPEREREREQRETTVMLLRAVETRALEIYGEAQPYVMECYIIIHSRR